MKTTPYAVVDTNVIVSALIAKSEETPPRKILTAVMENRLIPVISESIMLEYRAVLLRPKFNLRPDFVDDFLRDFRAVSLPASPTMQAESIPDPKDLPFLEAFRQLDEENAWLITGNLKHFPNDPRIVAPRDALTFLTL